MQKITSIHLNGKAYQLEEGGYEALRSYLLRAEEQLQDNPDKAEILADLEQAIAEKCGKFLTITKDIITTQEIEGILQEMGPVDGAASESHEKQDHASQGAATGAQTVKRLYLIREGAIIAGVCNGLAAYFSLDVIVVRVLFLILTIVTGGAWIPVYLALMFFVPYANTTEERAQAHGEIFNAQEVINRAKESYARLTDKEKWKSWKETARGRAASAKASAWRNRFESSVYARWTAPTYGGQTFFRRASPVFGFISMLLALVWIAALVSLIQTGAIFGWMVTAYMPLWLAIVLLFIVYHAVTGPMRAARWIAIGNQWQPMDYAYDPWHGVVDGLGVLFLVICSWFAYTHVPEVHAFINHLPELFRQVVAAIRQR